MPAKALHITFPEGNRYVLVLDTRNCFTCSFKEFLPFNAAMYYYSSFKAFSAIATGEAF